MRFKEGVLKLFEILKPRVYLESLTKLNLNKIKSTMKIKGMLIDLDNTTVAWGHDMIDEDTRKWIHNAKKTGYSICLVSNTHSGRVKKFAEIFDVPYLSNSCKPFHSSFKKALKIMGTDFAETMVIGDQIFTDIWGGNRLRLYTVLVSPLGKKDSLGTLIQRTLEKLIIGHWLKNHEVKMEKGNWPK